jgi:hypothetical protein
MTSTAIQIATALLMDERSAVRERNFRGDCDIANCNNKLLLANYVGGTNTLRSPIRSLRPHNKSRSRVSATAFSEPLKSRNVLAIQYISSPEQAKMMRADIADLVYDQADRASRSLTRSRNTKYRGTAGHRNSEGSNGQRTVCFSATRLPPSVPCLCGAWPHYRGGVTRRRALR